MNYSLKKIDIENKENVYKLLDSNHLLAIFTYSEIYYEEKTISGDILKAKDIIDKYIYDLLCKNNKNILEETRINNYFKVLITIIKDNPSIYFSNPIFKLDNKIIINYIGEERYKQIERDVIKYNTNAKVIYDKFINNENSITKQEYQYLITFMINTIGSRISNIDQIHENMIFKLLNSNKNYSDVRTKYFVLKYLLYDKTKEFKQKYNLYFCDEINGVKFNSLGGQSDEEIIINAATFRNSKLNDFRFVDTDKMNKKYVKKGFPIYKMFHALFHEIEHANQTEFLLKGIVNSKSISIAEYKLFDKYYGREEYELNYRFYDMEIDADENSYKKIINFYEKFVPKQLSLLDRELIRKKLQTSMKRSYSYKRNNDKEKKKYLNEIYLVELLNYIILKYPNELENYPCLKEFYNTSGSLKSIDQLLLQKDNYKKSSNDDSIFDKFILYHISNKQLDKLNLNNYSNENKITILFMIESILRYQIQTLFDINLGINDNREIEKLGYKIVKAKIDLINSILSFFNKNEVSYINNLIIYDLNQFKKVISLLENKFKRDILLPDEGENFSEFKYK